MIKRYIMLTKPGIIVGNLIAAVAGFFLASKGNIDWLLFIATVSGLGLIIASACVFNNYIDRGIDAKMNRTKRRALVTNKIPVSAALAYGTILGLLGSAILGLFTNLLTMAIALLGFFFYVVVYGYAKRKSVYGTHVGSISGAVPPVVGYVAVTGSIDSAAVILFLILVCWQMPHFFAIAIYRVKEYKAAGLPVMSVSRGVKPTKSSILLYTSGFVLAALALYFADYVGYTYALIVSVLGFLWLRLAYQGMQASNDEVWARSMFKFSLIVLLWLCGVISLDAWLP